MSVVSPDQVSLSVLVSTVSRDAIDAAVEPVHGRSNAPGTTATASRNPANQQASSTI